MGLLIEGKPGSRFSEEKGWEAYMPIKLKDNNFYLTLSVNEKMKGNDGCFYMYSKSGENVARCDFPNDHKYMYIYRDLVNTLNKTLETGKAIEPLLYKEPLEITEKGYVSVNTKKKRLSNLSKKKVSNEKNEIQGR